MPRYIAFLRAINVGGRVVKMEALRQHMALPGFKNIATYIQSGNVAFDHTAADKAALIKKIEAKLLKELGYEVVTLLLTVPELEAVINNNPFTDVPEDMNLHVTFLSAVPDLERTAKLFAMQTAHERFRFVNTEVYILVKKGAYGETKFSNTFIEKQLKRSATTRNWATVNKMVSL